MSKFNLKFPVNANYFKKVFNNLREEDLAL